jgi:twitching motility protein PilT
MHDFLKDLFLRMSAEGASDLHIRADAPPFFRVNGRIIKAAERPGEPEDVRKMMYGLLNEKQIEVFERQKEMDFAFSIENVGRFRANIYLQRGMTNCAVRLIPEKIRSITECGLPEEVVRKFCRSMKGLVLVTGATGSGKSTTLAAMIDEINSQRASHIITVEDPIEYVHKNKKSIVDQREIHADTVSFASALRHILRQDPDVIMVGELRDRETIEAALTVADTGHLVLGTLHTSDSVQSINRIVDIFPSDQQSQVRSQLALVLLGVMSQQLLQKKDGSGMTLACEILVATPGIRSMIRDSKEHQILSSLQTSQSRGMKTMDQALLELYESGEVDHEEVLAKSADPDALYKVITEKARAEEGLG